jgi:transposase-like protein
MMTDSPTLTSVKARFADWRRTRTSRRTPAVLRAEAVHLLSQYSAGRLCKELEINSVMLKRWRQQLRRDCTPPAMFIELAPEPMPAGAQPEEQTPLTLTVTRHQADGSRWTVSASLAPSQWQQTVHLFERLP